MSVTEAFEALTSGLEYPMFIVTAAADGERNGCLVGFATQCSRTEHAGGALVLDGCRGWVAGDVISRTDVGDHVAMAMRVTSAEVRDEQAGQLGFTRVKDFEPGHPA